MPPPPSVALSLLAFVLLARSDVVLGQHKTFGDTKFDLPADLPPEDLPPVADSQDAAPSTAASAPPPPVAPVVPVSAPPPPPAPPVIDTQPAVPVPPTQPAPPLQAIADSSTPPSTGGNSTGTPNSKTPLPSLPSLIELPNFVENGNVQPLTVPPSLVEPNNGTSNASSPSASSPSSAPPPGIARGRPQPVPLAKAPPQRNSVAAKLSKDGQKIVVRSKEWFREEFDVRNCPKSSDVLAKAIRAKFPRNLLKHGKDVVLAELLGTRLAECLRKQSADHWARLEKQLKLDRQFDRNEKDECRAGLVEEQIACMNIHSFTCQFVHPTYLFRLLPTRIIVQEGRIAEEGAEKCQKFARLLKAQAGRR
uniref:Uncharacterized protein n=1 Tax=Globodera rostochiensis TaxID=31243 RepID=A0A914GXL6_GLORO